MIRRPALALLALPLVSCQHVTQTNGDETISATSVFTNINVASDCLQMDGDGNVLSQTHHTLTTSGDAATLHEAGSIFGSALAFAGKFIPLPVPPAAAPGRMGAVPSPADSPAVTGCSGEKTVSTRPQPAPGPAPAPARPLADDEDCAAIVRTPLTGDPERDVVPCGRPAPPRQPAAFAPGWHQGVTGTRRRLEPITGDGRASYYTPGGRRYRISARAWLAWAGGGV